MKSHSPPPPTPALEDFCTNKEVDMSEREYRYPLYRCVRHPPLADGDDERKSIPRVRLEIVEPIQVGDGHNSQVLQLEFYQSGLSLSQGRNRKPRRKRSQDHLHTFFLP